MVTVEFESCQLQMSSDKVQEFLTELQTLLDKFVEGDYTLKVNVIRQFDIHVMSKHV